MSDRQRDVQEDQERTSCFCFDLLERFRRHMSRIRKSREIFRKIRKGKMITKEESEQYLYVFGPAEPEPRQPHSSPAPEIKSNADLPYAGSSDEAAGNILNGQPLSGEESKEKSSTGDLLHTGSSAHDEVERDNALPCQERPGQSLQDYTLLKVLGRGGFATIIMAEQKTTKQTFAMKIIDKKLIRSDKMVELVQTEKHVFEMASDSPFLVGMNSCFQTPTRLVFVTELACGGDMMYHMQRKLRLSENHARFYSAEISLGLNFLHDRGVVYRDLKFENILMDNEGHVKLTDYGLAKEGLEPRSRTRSFCGTRAYMAPEILVRIPYGFSVDWWSLGVILYGMMTGRLPFEVDAESTAQEKEEAVLRGALKIPTSLSATASSILIGLLKKNPGQRLGCHPQIGFEEIRSHPFFSDIDWVKLEHRQITPPYKPPLKSERDLENFNPEYTGDVLLTPDNSEAIDTNDHLRFQGFEYDWRASADAACSGNSKSTDN